MRRWKGKIGMRRLDLSTRALLIGLALAAGVFVGVRYVFGEIWNPTVRTVIVLAGALLGTLAGGYYLARQAVYRVMVHVLLVVVVDAALLLLLGLIPANPWLLGGMLLAGLGGAFWGQHAPIPAAGTPFAARGAYSSPAWGYSSPRRGVQLPGWMWRIWNPFRRMIQNRQVAQLYDQLLRRTRMDRELADRLIEFERRRNPQAGRMTLIRNALERLERDNR